MEQVTIRIAEQRDVENLKKLMHEYIVNFYQSPVPAAGKLDWLIGTLLKGDRGLQFVAENEGELVGFATLYFTFSTTRVANITVMNDLYVLAEGRGKGIAEQLFQTCLAFTKEQGYASMLWETANDNYRAQRFYEKMGATPGDWISYSL
ncbi:ribosomal protein S18 acetylase RimI-like enzyme [Salirhabdus euzebyi]|uniref:Ribosomal protein S18 acetylase RimI-like enzyme n=1 Tax=Salirhabdus euzebyi TaxID=394506 RepID=A0A841Q4N5_9BACI|nr:GNAT family N-acetyltransferase [Salirhabdus euzebyi]MBB6453312.1 ribosomal protein S18 acetylase RimI-like enzyme [Salirhabdus euzebyi]